ncbi:MAG: FAD-dependent monooxygenase [Bacteroidota bacterium]|nr:FAD-dependent monooxygenase [Bacteroidota bacterium]
MNQTDVIIIGAGPTGLMLACQLTRFDIDFIIIDSKPGPTEESRALVITSRSLEIYQQLGLKDKALSEGQIIESILFISESDKKVNINIGVFGEGMTDFPYIFSLEQSKNEQILYEYLIEKGKEVLWNTELKSFKQIDKGIVVTTLNNDVETDYNCKYLAGCDGAKSLVRHILNFKFEGGTYENKFFLADVDIDWDIKEEKIIGMPGENYIVGFFPLKGKNHYRILGTLPKEFYDKEDIGFKDVKRLVKEIYHGRIEFNNLNWFSIYKLHHRCVDKFSQGKVFLAGDAAHIHSPAGGQGMNTGLQDSYNLAWKLAYVLKDFAKEELLDTYNNERLPFAKWLMNFTDRAFGYMTKQNYFFKAFRKYLGAYFIKVALSSSIFKRRIFYTISQLWVNYSKSILSVNHSNQKLKFSAGDRVPYVLININNGESIFSLLTEPKFYLLLIGMNSNEELDEFIKKYENIFHKIELELTSQWKKLGVKKPIAIIVRPDEYIGLISDNINPGIVNLYMKRIGILFP